MPTDSPFVPLVGAEGRGLALHRRWPSATTLQIRCVFFHVRKLSNEPKSKIKKPTSYPYNLRNSPHHRIKLAHQLCLSVSSDVSLCRRCSVDPIQDNRERHLFTTSNPLNSESSGVQSTGEEVPSLMRKPFAHSLYLGRSFLPLLRPPPSTLTLLHNFRPPPGLALCCPRTPSLSHLQQAQRRRVRVLQSSPCPAQSTTAHTRRYRLNRNSVSESIKHLYITLLRPTSNAGCVTFSSR